MPEACEVCAGRGDNCPACNPAPERPPEPKPVGCQQCRAKDEQLASLMRIMERMVTPVGEVPPEANEACVHCGADVGPPVPIPGAVRVCLSCRVERNPLAVPPGTQVVDLTAQGGCCSVCQGPQTFGRWYFSQASGDLMCVACWDSRDMREATDDD